MKKLFVAIIVLLLILGCKKQLPEDFDPFGKLVYVEALSNTDGITAGSFGDIMIFNPDTKEKYRVTYDDYYDQSPSWCSDGTNIIFQSSCRTGSLRYKSLSSPRRIFEVSLKTLVIKQIDLNWCSSLMILDEKYLCQEDIYQPYCSKDGKFILFAVWRSSDDSSSYFGSYRIIVYDLKNESFKPLHIKLEGLYDYKISNDNHYLAVTTSHSNFNTAIIIYNMFENKKIKRFSKDKWNYDVRSFHGNKLYFTGKDLNLDKPPSNLYELDLATMENKLLYSFSNYNIQEFVMRDSVSAFFINEDPYHRNDIYLLDFKTWKAEPLTTDGLQKIGLDYLPPKKDK